jgi:2-dehydro-3-deoxygluconokinase
MPRPARRIVCLGEGLVELALEPGSDVAGIGFGGDACNVAVMAALLGADAAIAATLGDDALGRRLAAFWRAAGADVGAVAWDAERPTGIYVNELARADTARRFDYHRSGSAGSRYPTAAAAAVAAAADVLPLSGITLAVSGELAAAAAAAGRALRPEAGLSMALNVRPALGPDLGLLREWAARADVVFASEEDALLLYETCAPDELSARLPNAELVLTAGADGASVCRGGEWAHAEAPDVRVVDTAGAGDALAGAYLACRASAAPPASALQLAVRAATSSARRRGCAAAYPTASELAREAAA